MIIINNINNIDLKSTITCGQIFRYYIEEDDSYTIILKDRVVNIKLVNDKLYVDSNNFDNLDSIIRKYLDLDRDYNKILDNINIIDDKIDYLINKSRGLKIINQDPLECIISYVISQNNTVKNIHNCLNNICKMCGNKAEFRGHIYYLFPSLDELSRLSLDDFRNCKCGFRDKYLIGVINNIVDNKLDINNIYSMKSDVALDYLILNKGIGFKVASCILLFAYQKFDVFPVDTWVKKYMLDNYNIIGEKNIRNFAQENFKEYCGLIIQYMFNGMRNG